MSQTKHVTEEMFLAAAESLALQVSDDEKAMGRIYPALDRIREVSLHVAVAVAEESFRVGLNQVARPADLIKATQAAMYDPAFEDPTISCSL